jgi:hypothetical protein
MCCMVRINRNRLVRPENGVEATCGGRSVHFCRQYTIFFLAHESSGEPVCTIKVSTVIQICTVPMFSEHCSKLYRISYKTVYKYRCILSFLFLTLFQNLHTQTLIFRAIHIYSIASTFHILKFMYVCLYYPFEHSGHVNSLVSLIASNNTMDYVCLFILVEKL